MDNDKNNHYNLKMREFDEKLLGILKTETNREYLLRTDAGERKNYIEDSRQWSDSRFLSDILKKDVTVSRRPRYVESPPNIVNIVEMYYVVCGSAVLMINNEDISLSAGDIFLKNQYTSCGIRRLGEDDIVIAVLLKPHFLENACVCMTEKTALSEFMVDTLRSEVSWNKYLHFSGIDDVAVQNLIETIVYVAFPHLDDENIATGSETDNAVTEHLMLSLLSCLSGTMNTLAADSPISYDEIVRQTVTDYIESDYQSVSLAELARSLNQSESALSRQIKSLFGMGYKELL